MGNFRKTKMKKVTIDNIAKSICKFVNSVEQIEFTGECRDKESLVYKVYLHIN